MTWSISIREMGITSTVTFFMSGWKVGGGSLRHGPHCMAVVLHDIEKGELAEKLEAFSSNQS
jgi:hypothetical protein